MAAISSIVTGLPERKEKIQTQSLRLLATPAPTRSDPTSQDVRDHILSAYLEHPFGMNCFTITGWIKKSSFCPSKEGKHALRACYELGADFS
jgi:hypothetical protein